VKSCAHVDTNQAGTCGFTWVIRNADKAGESSQQLGEADDAEGLLNGASDEDERGVRRDDVDDAFRATT
jgi:hypothetical protein